MWCWPQDSEAGLTDQHKCAIFDHVLCHQDDPLRAHYVVIPALLPDNLKIETLSGDWLPDDWRSPQPSERLREIGMRWLEERRSAVLAVPSAVIPAEHNYLLNPMHPEFSLIAIGEPVKIVTDSRLIPAK